MKRALAGAGVVYLLRWPVQVFCFAVAIRHLAGGRRKKAAAWALAAAAALASPYLILLVASPAPAPLKGAGIAAVAIGAGALIRRRALRRAGAAPPQPGSD